MELSILLTEQLAVLLLIGVAGYISIKTGVMKAEDCKVLSSLILYIIMPCVIVKAFQMELTPERIHGVAVLVLFAVLVHVVWILVTKLLGRIGKVSTVAQVTLIYSNSGNMIYPLVTALFGEAYVFYACIFNVVQLFFIWTHCVSLIQEKKEKNIRKIFCNPVMVSIGIGLLLLLFHIKLPTVINSTLGTLGGTIGPVSMLVIGMLTAQTDLKKVFLDGKAYLVAFGRLVVYPLLVMGGLYISGYLVHYPEEKMYFEIAMLAVTAPPAAIVSQFALQYQKDAVKAGIYNVIGVIACIITMPLLIRLFEFIF